MFRKAIIILQAFVLVVVAQLAVFEPAVNQAAQADASDANLTFNFLNYHVIQDSKGTL